MDDQLLDTEELEQIPWSSLMPEQPAGVDRRVYLVLGVVGAIVVLFFGARFLSGTSQPQATAQIPTEFTADAPPPAPSAPGPVSGLIVSEADLMAGRPPEVAGEVNWRSIALAEWYVTDYFTTDGSPETQRSLDSVGLPESSAEESSVLRPEPGMYVEWARAIAVTRGDDVGHETVDVIFRTISLSDDGFTRDPVAAVSVEVVTGDETGGIFGPPVTIPVPDLGIPELDDPQPGSSPVSESP